MANQAILTAISCNLIAFISGATFSWSSPVLPKLNTSDVPFERRPTEEEQSWISSLLTLGAIFGPFIFGHLSDRIGRKLTILLLGLPYLASFSILTFSKIISLYYIARFLAGLALGGVFTVVPMYIGEIAEDSNRGTLSSLLNVFVTGGLLFSYAVGPYVSLTVFNLILTIFPAIFVIVFFVVAPESPYYHVAKGNYKAATQSLCKLRGSIKNDNELNNIKATLQKNKKGSPFDLIKYKNLTKALVISVSLVGFQQLSGNNAVLFYSQTIFENSGSSLNAEISAIVVGTVFFLTSFVTPIFVDRLGRKILLYFSAVGMILSLIPLGLYFHLKEKDCDVSSITWLPLVAMVCYIVTYNLGFGPLPWAVMGELFPSNVKSMASSLTSSFCWCLGFIITKFFQSVVEEIGMGTIFFMFASFCIGAFFFALFYVIETKGKSFQEIQDALE